MLTLSRRKNEEVVLSLPDGTVLGTTMVIGIKGDRVILGFEFRKDVTIHRREIQDQIDAEKRKEVAGATT